MPYRRADADSHNYPGTCGVLATQCMLLRYAQLAPRSLPCCSSPQQNPMTCLWHLRLERVTVHQEVGMPRHNYHCARHSTESLNIRCFTSKTSTNCNPGLPLDLCHGMLTAVATGARCIGALLPFRLRVVCEGLRQNPTWRTWRPGFFCCFVHGASRSRPFMEIPARFVFLGSCEHAGHFRAFLQRTSTT